MGFIKVVSETTSDNMINIWSDGVSSQGLEIVDRMMFAGEACENGCKIIVRENEVLMILRDGELFDYIAKPGAYIYHEKIEKGDFQDTGELSFQEISACIGKWMDQHGQEASPNGIYYLCCNETSSDVTVESKPEIWICVSCGGKSVGKFCGQCGAMRK